MWCVYVVCVCGVCMWCVYVVCVCGVCMWCVYVVCVCVCQQTDSTLGTVSVTRTPVYPSNDPIRFSGAYEWTVTFRSLMTSIATMTPTALGFGACLVCVLCVCETAVPSRRTYTCGAVLAIRCVRGPCPVYTRYSAVRGAVCLQIRCCVVCCCAMSFLGIGFVCSCSQWAAGRVRASPCHQ
jgi:hypothetical protein